MLFPFMERADQVEEVKKIGYEYREFGGDREKLMFLTDISRGLAVYVYASRIKGVPTEKQDDGIDFHAILCYDKSFYVYHKTTFEISLISSGRRAKVGRFTDYFMAQSFFQGYNSPKCKEYIMGYLDKEEKFDTLNRYLELKLLMHMNVFRLFRMQPKLISLSLNLFLREISISSDYKAIKFFTSLSTQRVNNGAGTDEGIFLRENTDIGKETQPIFYRLTPPLRNHFIALMNNNYDEIVLEDREKIKNIQDLRYLTGYKSIHFTYLDIHMHTVLSINRIRSTVDKIEVKEMGRKSEEVPIFQECEPALKSLEWKEEWLTEQPATGRPRTSKL